MKIELSLFIGVILSLGILVVFCLEYINNNSIIRAKKEMRLKKKKCEVCSSAYFVSVFFEFWHCPLCGSINKEK
ncbi:MAG: hypothetical protein ABIH08_06630 [Candidatus Omnitrophota bacterium]